MKEYFDVSYETVSYVEIGKTIKLNAKYVIEDKVYEINNWDTFNKDTATVDSTGLVTGIKDGTVLIRALYTEDIYFTFLVYVIDDLKDDVIKFILENNNPNAFTVYNLPIGAGKPAYYYDLVGSISNIIFDDFKVDRTYYDKLPLNVKNNGYMNDVEFITVHYTGNMRETADADNNCSYFNNLEYQASIHYVTGRSNLYTDWNEDEYYAFAGLSEKYKGWHASDSAQGEHKWLDTNIKVKVPGESVNISINEDSHFTINGISTNIKVPEREDGLKITGPTFIYEGKVCSSINKQGIAYKIIDGKYYIGNTWWGRQQFGCTLCNIGGNHNSIGIESCVDMGSNLMHTWHETAQLCADIMKRYNLDISRVVTHHYFSGKDCPQPHLANDQFIWKKFITLTSAEYERITKFKDYKFELEVLSDKDNLLNKQGLLKQSNNAQLLIYKIKCIKNNEIKEITLPTIVESRYKKQINDEIKSLQDINFEIK